MVTGDDTKLQLNAWPCCSQHNAHKLLHKLSRKLLLQEGRQRGADQLLGELLPQRLEAGVRVQASSQQDMGPVRLGVRTPQGPIGYVRPINRKHVRHQMKQICVKHQTLESQM